MAISEVASVDSKAIDQPGHVIRIAGRGRAIHNGRLDDVVHQLDREHGIRASRQDNGCDVTSFVNTVHFHTRSGQDGARCYENAHVRVAISTFSSDHDKLGGSVQA